MKIMENGANSILADKAYVDYIAKQLEELIIDHINQEVAHRPLYKKQSGCNIDKNSFDAKTIDLEKTIYARDIAEDSGHRFVSDHQIAVFNNKPSMDEMVHRAEVLDEKVIAIINNRIDKILNSPYSLNKLKELSRLITDDINMDRLLEEISMKLDSEDFIKHLQSRLHITSEDRIALDKLAEIIRGIDYNSDLIFNKPKTMKASGGDSDTVGGYNAEQLMNRQTEDYIIGNDDKCDINVSDTSIFIEDASIYPYIRFKSGKYAVNKMVTKNNTIVGSGRHNCIISANNLLIQSSSISHIKFIDSNVRISSNTEVENCEFENSTVSLVGEHCISIKSCNFNKSPLKYETAISGCFIVDNIFDYPFVKFIGGNNVIKDNIIK